VYVCNLNPDVAVKAGGNDTGDETNHVVHGLSFYYFYLNKNKSRQIHYLILTTP